jgi:hypothetical protein
MLDPPGADARFGAAMRRLGVETYRRVSCLPWPSVRIPETTCRATAGVTSLNGMARAPATRLDRIVTQA